MSKELWIVNHATWEPLRVASKAEVERYGEEVFDFTYEGMLVAATIAPKPEKTHG